MEPLQSTFSKSTRNSGDINLNLLILSVRSMVHGNNLDTTYLREGYEAQLKEPL